MKFLTQLSRILVGGLFIFSGLIKLNDPMGFSFKLNDYFAEGVLNLPFLQPYTLPLALFIVTLEVLVGVALLMGFMRKLTTWLLLLMIVFFTFLTFYSAYFNKVTDCGCFGNAIPLTPWESFTKDVILLVLILVVFFNRNYIQPLLSKTGNGVVMGLSLVGCILLGNHVLAHLPIMDFRPYEEGKSIVEGRKSAEELGKQPTEYGTIYYLKNQKTGEEKKISSDAYVADKWYQKDQWKIQEDKSETVVLKEGYKPPIHDFVISLDGQEITDKVLNAPAIFMVISYKMEITEESAYAKINELAANAQKNNVPLIGASASLPDVVQKKTEKLDINFPMTVMDETTLKTIVRSNPGLVLLKKGVVVKKWHYNDIPSFAKIQKKHL